MAQHASFIVGIVVLAYLSTFIVFAIIRVLFGVSIQRLWWSRWSHHKRLSRNFVKCRGDLHGLGVIHFSVNTWWAVGWGADLVVHRSLR